MGLDTDERQFVFSLVLTGIVALAAGVAIGFALDSPPVEVREVPITNGSDTIDPEDPDDSDGESLQVDGVTVDIQHRGSNVLMDFGTDFRAACVVTYGKESFNNAKGCSEPGKVYNHSASLSGLDIGETYRYRIIFIGEDDTITFTGEKTFTAESLLN